MLKKLIQREITIKIEKKLLIVIILSIFVLSTDTIISFGKTNPQIDLLFNQGLFQSIFDRFNHNNTIENTWCSYFSSLAQTIAACSALLVAIAVIKLQNLDSSLNEIEKSIVKIMFAINKIDIYKENAFIFFIEGEIRTYFKLIEQFSLENKKSFSQKEYLQSKEYIDSLISQGMKLDSQRNQLYRSLLFSFCGTLIFSGVSILILPIAQWGSQMLFNFLWVLSGVFLSFLFWNYFRLIYFAVNNELKGKIK
jgi:hypothetical protein